MKNYISADGENYFENVKDINDTNYHGTLVECQKRISENHSAMFKEDGSFYGWYNAEENLQKNKDVFRSGRDKKLIETDYFVSRHSEQLELGIETKITQDEYIELLQYRQGLRDSPENMILPEKPSFL